MPFLDSSSWWERERDVWPDRNDGEYHQSGIGCPCAPWWYSVPFEGPQFPGGTTGALQTVVVHQWFYEKIIHTGSPRTYDDSVMDEVEWEIRQ